jgi:hypothetical protein
MADKTAGKPGKEHGLPNDSWGTPDVLCAFTRPLPKRQSAGRNPRPGEGWKRRALVAERLGLRQPPAAFVRASWDSATRRRALSPSPSSGQSRPPSMAAREGACTPRFPRIPAFSRLARKNYSWQSRKQPLRNHPRRRPCRPGMIRLCSLMFAYVRICSLIVKKMAARRQGHQPWIIFVFRVGNRTPVFQPHDGKGREWDGSDEGDRSNRLADTLAPAKTKKPVPDGQILRLIALNCAYFFSEPRAIQPFPENSTPRNFKTGSKRCDPGNAFCCQAEGRGNESPVGVNVPKANKHVSRQGRQAALFAAR